MKYTNEVIINAPIAKVVELFEDPNNIEKWQPGFISMQQLSGERGEVGSTYKLKYKMGKRDIEMVETITEKNLPHVFSGTYETQGVWNEVKNHFEDQGSSTRYWTENEFKMSGMMKLMAWLMPGAFRKQSQKYLDLFKAFVEEEVAKN